MLNLRPIFTDAIHAFSEHEAHLEIPSLPATVFLMQADVINHYRYAVTHYLSLSLNEHYLQDSSIGTPYEKWAKFTNDDFDMLGFAITNLIRYTSRLIYETEACGLKAAKRYTEMKTCSSNYISPLVEINRFGKRVGIHVNNNETLTLTAFATESMHDGTLGMTSVAGGPTEYYHVTVDNNGHEHKRLISLEEYRQLSECLRPIELAINDRSMLNTLKTEGLREIESLIPLNRQFGDLCNSYTSHREVARKFDNLNEAWWV